ncbi:hypothetical protein [Enterococcus sp. AZ196]|uniref:hypothetical protein n=1 Tax=Enterococcus sp. AZ196 TaxID=2774659 RepID=UPI003D2D2842
MKLVPVTTQKAIELISQGEDGYSQLWWSVSAGTIGNYVDYKFPTIERIFKTEWFIEEDSE